MFFWAHTFLGVTSTEEPGEKITDEEECEEEEEEEESAVEYGLPMGVSETGSCRT